tara:strand:- start:62 stop:313 length:252 start_codon:yes stop_codon:yes gene_type:complete
MNKKKLVELADQVLMDVDDELQNEAREFFEKELCRRLKNIFLDAGAYFETSRTNIWFEERKEAYESVKPVLDDCLNKILGEPK